MFDLSDRKNYDYSFHQELITKSEFMDRVFKSTCMSSNATKMDLNW